MGKGKGLIERRVIRVQRGISVFEFIGISPIKLNGFIK